MGFAAHSSQVSPSLSTKPGKSTHGVSSGIGVDVVGTGVVVLVVGSPASLDVPFVLFLGGGVVGTSRSSEAVVVTGAGVVDVIKAPVVEIDMEAEVWVTGSDVVEFAMPVVVFWLYNCGISSADKARLNTRTSSMFPCIGPSVAPLS